MSRRTSVVKNLVKTRIPTGYGEFNLYLYNEHGKEHLALVKGEVSGQALVPVRVHSECLTGDVFGSRRCDCGDQLKHTLQYLGRLPCGILVYLRQEGRGIGLRKKLEAYNLQDTGMDTVEANIHLGHQPDERDYGIAARILRDLGPQSIRLITNNPHKVDELTAHGIQVEARIPIEVGHHQDNLDYLRSKAAKMAHLLTFREETPEHRDLAFIEPLLDQLSLARAAANEAGPFVTLAYAQDLDGGTAAEAAPTSRPALTLTRHLRAQHDALLVDIDSLPAAPPSLRQGQGTDPRPVFLDDQLRTPPEALVQGGHPPLILTTGTPDPARVASLTERGAEVVAVGTDAEGGIDLLLALRALRERGIHTLMVEGGAATIRRFLRQRLVDYAVIAITPRLGGGPQAIGGPGPAGEAPTLGITDCQYQTLGSDIIAHGPVGYG
ncbi:3,4-dihydroxy 2-butanone 4-phosphate synthase / GTP cyclohydrolase II [Methylomagnum ishizawai]|uniref:GTP cyclohydrolase-2 n=1 Tax=Methylomagnum ishizawai TaxID=1760988 RepID=A0A1Y6CZQ1_9GAMM|nr:3,4-dihydroxy 2-butanone 4-phosphate synthase / GTP cyclohydrolase II [Methylomagnum ishizawai]